MDEQKKYINAEAIHDILASHFCACSDETEEALHSVWDELKAIPAADVQPVKRGRWIESNPQNSDRCRLIECDQCGNSYIVGFNVSYEDWTQSDNRNYCGRCGAYMRS